jgi:hypothetical protein
MNWNPWAELKVLRRQLDQVKRANEQLGDKLANQGQALLTARKEREEARAEMIQEKGNCRSATTAKAQLERELAQVKQALEAVGVLSRLKSMPCSKPELVQALRGVTPTTEWWRVIHALIEEQEQANTEALCTPEALGELAHFNRGRLAALCDLKGALLQHHAASQATSEEG